ncbi:MAG TPA: hypothetical protein VGR90_07120, partial [Acidimicrobiales bacterium]|nr:hypothetical protein [Acidimicrobiales bacterium]
PPGNPGGAAPTTPAVLPSGGEGTGPQAASAAPAPTNLTSGSSSGIPGTVGWGLGATALAVAAWLGSQWWRRRRGRGRGMLAYLVGVAPFLVLLYFFFENVTRLLPPSV